MNFDYCLETSFISARRNSHQPAPGREPRSNPSSCFTHPVMDLNDITREYERYKRKLSDERMVDLREMLQSPLLAVGSLAVSSVSGETALSPDCVPRLPLESRRTLDGYERALAEARRCNSL